MRPRVALGLWAGIPVMLVVLATLGGLAPSGIPGLPEVPLPTLWALPIDLYARDLAAALTLGFLLVGTLLMPTPSPTMAQLASLFAAAWWFTLVIQMPLTVSEVLALPLEASLDPRIITSLLAQTTLGQTIVVQLVLTALIALLAWASHSRRAFIVLIVLAATAAFMPGFGGHSGLEDGHEAATVSLGLHLVTAGLWIGGVVALAALVTIDGATQQVQTAVRRFSGVALACVIILAESGLLNAAMRMETMAELVTSQYGAIVLAKAVVLLLLAGIGWRHRERLRAAALGDAEAGSPAAFRRLLAIEATWMGVAIGLAVTLSRTAPPAGAVGDVVAPGALVTLALAAPVLVVLGFGRRGRSVPRRLLAYPEATMIAMMAVVVAIASILPDLGLLALPATALVVAAGWLAIAVAVAGRSVPAVAIAMVAWPVALWWLMRGTPGEWASGTWVVIALAEGLLVLTLVAITRSAERTPGIEHEWSREQEKEVMA